jgi:hypothetical protein
MAVKTAGFIRLSQIQTEFTGANPISMSEYYKNGPYVPSTVAAAAGAWEDGTGPISSTHFLYDRYYRRLIIRWDGAVTYVGYNVSGVYPVFSQNGYDYEPGAYNYAQSTRYYYNARRRITAGGSEIVNTGIPTSGTISMSQFYGGRKT